MAKIAAVHVHGNQPGQRVAIVAYLESGYYPQPNFDNPLVGPEFVEETVADINRRLNIPQEVADAMKAGSMFGWDVPAAEPAHLFFGESARGVN